MPAKRIKLFKHKKKLLVFSKRAVMKLSDEIIPSQYVYTARKSGGGIIKTIYFFKKLFSFVSQQLQELMNCWIFWRWGKKLNKLYCDSKNMLNFQASSHKGVTNYEKRKSLEILNQKFFTSFGFNVEELLKSQICPEDQY